MPMLKVGTKGNYPVEGAVNCTNAFSRTDFRGDLAKFNLPTLVIHGGSDAIVPFEVSGARTRKAVAGSVLPLVKGSPHGFNLSHAGEFHQHLLEFLRPESCPQRAR